MMLLLLFWSIVCANGLSPDERIVQTTDREKNGFTLPMYTVKWTESEKFSKTELLEIYHAWEKASVADINARGKLADLATYRHDMFCYPGPPLFEFPSASATLPVIPTCNDFEKAYTSALSETAEISDELSKQNASPSPEVRRLLSEQETRLHSLLDLFPKGRGNAAGNTAANAVKQKIEKAMDKVSLRHSFDLQTMLPDRLSTALPDPERVAVTAGERLDDLKEKSDQLSTARPLADSERIEVTAGERIGDLKEKLKGVSVTAGERIDDLKEKLTPRQLSTADAEGIAVTARQTIADLKETFTPEQFSTADPDGLAVTAEENIDELKEKWAGLKNQTVGEVFDKVKANLSNTAITQQLETLLSSNKEARDLTIGQIVSAKIPNITPEKKAEVAAQLKKVLDDPAWVTRMQSEMNKYGPEKFNNLFGEVVERVAGVKETDWSQIGQPLGGVAGDLTMAQVVQNINKIADALNWKPKK